MAGVVLMNNTHITVPRVVSGFSREYYPTSLEQLITPYGLILPLDITGFNVFNRMTNRGDLQHEPSRHGLSRLLLLRHDRSVHDLKLVVNSEGYVNGSLRVPFENFDNYAVAEEVTNCTLRAALGMAENNLKKALEYLSLIAPIKPEYYDIYPIDTITAMLKQKRCFKKLQLESIYKR